MTKYLFLLLPFLFACDPDEEYTETELTDMMEVLDAQIQDLIVTSCDGGTQCKSMAIGARACGGPSHYLVYSDKTDEDALAQLVETYTDLNKQLNELTGEASICSLAPVPEPSCESGNCTDIS